MSHETICVKCSHQYNTSIHKGTDEFKWTCPKCGERYRGLRFPPTGDEEKHTCPYRENNPGPWAEHLRSDAKNEDTWQLVGGDRTCSFCGSCHPMDFLAIMRHCIGDDSHIILDLSDNSEKIYINRPGVPNCDYGAIKFKVTHMPNPMRTQMEVMWPEAERKSQIRNDIILGQIQLNRDNPPTEPSEPTD